MTPALWFLAGGATFTLGIVAIAIVLGIRERRSTRQPPEVVRARGLELVK